MLIQIVTPPDDILQFLCLLSYYFIKRIICKQVTNLHALLSYRHIGQQYHPWIIQMQYAGLALQLDKYNHSFVARSEEHTSELQSRFDLVCRLLLAKKKNDKNN